MMKLKKKINFKKYNVEEKTQSNQGLTWLTHDMRSREKKQDFKKKKPSKKGWI